MDPVAHGQRDRGPGRALDGRAHRLPHDLRRAAGERGQHGQFRGIPRRPRPRRAVLERARDRAAGVGGISLRGLRVRRDPHLDPESRGPLRAGHRSGALDPHRFRPAHGRGRVARGPGQGSRVGPRAHDRGGHRRLGDVRRGGSPGGAGGAVSGRRDLVPRGRRLRWVRRRLVGSAAGAPRRDRRGGLGGRGPAQVAVRAAGGGLRAGAGRRRPARRLRLPSPVLLLRRGSHQLRRFRPAELPGIPGAEGVDGAPAGRSRGLRAHDQRRHPAGEASPRAVRARIRRSKP